MNVLSDLGIPRDVRHISGNGVHTFRFINAAGKSTLFKWSWKPMLGHRALVYDEAVKIAGKNNNFQRVDLYNSIEAGLHPEWEFQVQLFPDDGTYMWKGMDLLDPTIVIPFDMNPPITLGKMTLNRNPTNFFAESESVSFAPSNVVKGVSFVPDPLLQWRLMSYDDTASHRHNSPNGYLLPVNRAIVPTNNNYRDGYMQPLLFQGASTSSPNDIHGVVGASLNSTSPNSTIPFTGIPPETASGEIGRYPNLHDSFGQARAFWSSLDKYAKQHTVDAYRFELGHVSDKRVQQRYIDDILNKIDNCLARRVADGIGATLPSSMKNNTTGEGSNTTTTGIRSFYPLTPSYEPNKSLAGLVIGILANDTRLSLSDLLAIAPVLAAENATFEVVAPRINKLDTGVVANQSFITTSSVFYDAIIVGSTIRTNGTATAGKMGAGKGLDAFTQFVQEAYGHGKAVGVIGAGGGGVDEVLKLAGVEVDKELGVFAGSAGDVVREVVGALKGPVRFPERFGVDDEGICG